MLDKKQDPYRNISKTLNAFSRKSRAEAVKALAKLRRLYGTDGKHWIQSVLSATNCDGEPAYCLIGGIRVEDRYYIVGFTGVGERSPIKFVLDYEARMLGPVKVRG